MPSAIDRHQTDNVILDMDRHLDLLLSTHIPERCDAKT